MGHEGPDVTRAARDCDLLAWAGREVGNVQLSAAVVVLLKLIDACESG